MYIFLYQGFVLRTLVIPKISGGKRGSSFNPHYHLRLLVSIQTFICNFACDHVFLISSAVTTWLMLDEIYHLIELPFTAI